MFSSLKQKAIDFIEPYKQQNPATYAAAEQAVGAILIADGFLGTPHPLGGQARRGIFGTIGGMILGIIFMFAPLIFGNLSGVNSMTATTSATVVSVGMPVTSNSVSNGVEHQSSSCSLTASYTVNGIQYTQQESGDSSSNCGLVEGQTITINYNPANPGSFAYDLATVKYVFWIFFAAGIFAFLSSLVLFFVRLITIIFGWKLLRDGRKNAASLPPGTNLETIIAEIKQNFTANLFGFPAGTTTPPANGIGGMQL